MRVPDGLVAAWSFSYHLWLVHAPGYERLAARCGSRISDEDRKRKLLDVARTIVRICGRCRRLAPEAMDGWVTRLAGAVTEARDELTRLDGWPQVRVYLGGDPGEFEPVDTEALNVTGRDGHGLPTPTVRELAAILAALPPEVQDLPVTRYCEDGVRGINYESSLDGRPFEEDTRHVAMW